MKINCNCIANDNGHCTAETCHGEIRALDARPETSEARRQRYMCAVQPSFADIIYSEIKRRVCDETGLSEDEVEIEIDQYGAIRAICRPHAKIEHIFF